MRICCFMHWVQIQSLWQPRGVGWGRRWEGDSRGKRHVYLWLIHIAIWQKPTQYCEAIILQLKINKKETILYVFMIETCNSILYLLFSCLSCPLNHEFLEGRDDHSFTSLSFTTSGQAVFDMEKAIHQACWEFYHIIKDHLVPMQFILLQDIEK